MQTRNVTGGDFSCKRQLETPLRCKLQERIASCDMALTTILILQVSFYIVILRYLSIQGDKDVKRKTKQK